MNYIHAHYPSLFNRRVYIDCICFGVSFHTWATFGAEYHLRSWSELLSFGYSDGWLQMFAWWFVKADWSVQQIAKRLTYFGQSMASHEGGDLNENCLVILSGIDDTIPTYDIRDYVAERKLPCTVLINDNWRHGGFLWQEDPNNIWQKVCDWVSPEKKSLKRVKSDPSIRGHLFAAGS